MFRLITAHQPGRSAFLLCDSRDCGIYLSAAIDLGADREQASMAFIQAALKIGWVIGLDAHLCPECAKRARGEERRIELAGNLAGLN